MEFANLSDPDVLAIEPIQVGTDRAGTKGNKILLKSVDEKIRVTRYFPLFNALTGVYGQAT